MARPRLLDLSISISIFFIPFGICDLYYGYSDDSCLHRAILNSKINFPLSTWLKVDGYLMLLLLAISTALGLICMKLKNENISGGILVVTKYTLYIFAIFRLTWVIIGAVMFWGYLFPHRYCGSGVSSYMWANLIIYLISVNLLCLRGKQNEQDDQYTSQKTSRSSSIVP